ncbi:hypothetical protein BH09GEM1_BH09GEM1_07570 [soil metagenome]
MSDTTRRSPRKRRDLAVAKNLRTLRYVTPLRTTFEWENTEDGLPFLRSVTQLEWDPTGLIDFFNIDMFVVQCDDLHTLGIPIPPMPPGVQVRLTARQFARVLGHPVPDIREWMVVNIVPRIRLRRSVRRGP